MFLTIGEIVSGMYRHNSTATEYALALACYKRLTPEVKLEVQRRGEELFIKRERAA